MRIFAGCGCKGKIMNRCECGSYALNEFPSSGLCDRCYWKAQRDKLLQFVKLLHAKLEIDGAIHYPDNLLKRCYVIINEVDK